MSEKVRLESLHRIESVASLNLELLDQCERLRGFIPDDMRDQFNKDDRDLQVRAEMYKLSSRAVGRKVPDREYLHRPTYCGNFLGLSHFREGGRHVLRFYGVIGKDAGQVSSDKFHEVLWNIPDDDDIVIRFNSPGGCYKNSVEIANAISKRTGETRAIVDGVCASGASIVCMRCNPIGIGRSAFFMCHFARVTLRDSLTAEDLDIATRKMRQTERELINEYTHRWKGSVEELVAALDQEREFTGHEAVASGLADYVDENATVATREEIEQSVKKFEPEAWRESERKNYAKYRIKFERWKHAATCMAND